MRRIQRERLSDYFKFIRVTVGGRLPMRGDLLWGFLSNFSPHSTLILCVCVQLPLHLFFLCMLVSACIIQSVRLFSPVHFQSCVWTCSRATDSPAHRRRWHLLWDPRRWQGAQPLPEGQGAAGDPPPQPHGQGELLGWARAPRLLWKRRISQLSTENKCMKYVKNNLLAFAVLAATF